MARESPYPEIPVDEALARVLSRLRPLPALGLGLDEAAGRVLAEDLVARQDMPPFAAAAKDGYALRAAEGLAPRRLDGESTAGTLPTGALAAGAALRITTGAALPAGADAVLMVEQADEAEGWVRPRVEVAAGADVRPAGQDYRAGESLLGAGTELVPPALGVLASAGLALVRVHPRPRVAVFSSGDELVPPEAEPGPGQIRDSNQTALAAAVRAAGGELVLRDRLGDSPGELERLAAAVGAVDVVITSGGVSMGHKDLIKPWLAAQGEVLFGRVRMRPGKPMTAALVGGKPVFALPGFPVSSLVAFELFVRPALRALAGQRELGRPRWWAVAGHDLAHASDRAEFQRAFVRREGGDWVATTTGFQGSGRLLSFHGANALLELPEGRGHTAAGSRVRVLMLDLPPWPDGEA
jgi:molybdenum cofactor synthesis domain-containing protein